MPVVVTLMSKVRDWKALRQQWREVCAHHAAPMTVSRYHLLRNVHDVSAALVLIEMPDLASLNDEQGVLPELRRCLHEQALSREDVWEAIESSEQPERR